MELGHMAVVLGIFLFLLKTTTSYEVNQYDFLMPDVNPNRDELYLCTPTKIVPDRSYYIVEFQPNAEMHVVHHMILFGCSKPGTNLSYWDCGEMVTETTSSKEERANPCADGSHVLYAWARDAPTLKLPEDVGFQVGRGTQIAYLVLQVHYAKKFPEDYLDRSGLRLVYTEEPRNKLAGVLLLATGGIIPAHSTNHMESACLIREQKTIHPFAYRPHTHSLGKVVTGYQVKRDERGNDTWILLGKRDPLTPQMFYPTFSKAPITTNDFLAARCTMHSDRDWDTRVGPTNDDEMCNFYLMYYVDGGIEPLKMKYCITSGPPSEYWSNSPYHFTNIPK